MHMRALYSTVSATTRERLSFDVTFLPLFVASSRDLGGWTFVRLPWGSSGFRKPSATSQSGFCFPPDGFRLLPFVRVTLTFFSISFPAASRPQNVSRGSAEVAPRSSDGKPGKVAAETETSNPWFHGLYRAVLLRNRTWTRKRKLLLWDEAFLLEPEHPKQEIQGPELWLSKLKTLHSLK